MRWFRVPTFSGIEAAADDADRGTLRLVEGCLPVGPGGLHSGPVWEDIGTVDRKSSGEYNSLTGVDDAAGNSILLASRFNQVHDVKVFPAANKNLQSMKPCYDVSAGDLYHKNTAYLSAVGDRLVAFGDGTSAALFAGQGPPMTSSATSPEGKIHHLEYVKFPNCRFFVIGPHKTLFAGGDPANPLTIYISEPAGLTQSSRDSLYSLEATSRVDLLMTDASEVTALSCVAGNVAAHTDAGIFLLSPPTPDQANTGYRVEQASTSAASAAVNLQVVAGEDGTQPYYLGFDGQIWKDPQGPGSEQKATSADSVQASASAKGRWDTEHPTDLSESFSAYEPEIGQYWVYMESDEWVSYRSQFPPEPPYYFSAYTNPHPPTDLAGEVAPLGPSDLTAVTPPARPWLVRGASNPRNPMHLAATTAIGIATDLGATTASGTPQNFRASTPVGKPADLGATTTSGTPQNFTVTTDLGEPEDLGATTAVGQPLTFTATTDLGEPEDLGATTAPGKPTVLTATTVPAAPTGLFAATNSVLSLIPTTTTNISFAVAIRYMYGLSSDVWLAVNEGAAGPLTGSDPWNSWDSLHDQVNPSAFSGLDVTTGISVTSAILPGLTLETSTLYTIGAWIEDTVNGRTYALEPIQITTLHSGPEDLTAVTIPVEPDDLGATTVPAISGNLTATTAPAEPTVLEATTVLGEPTVLGATTAPAEPTVLEATTVLEEPTVLGATTAPAEPSDIGAGIYPGRPGDLAANTIPVKPTVLAATTLPVKPTVLAATTIPVKPTVLAATTVPAISGNLTATTVPAEPTVLEANTTPRPARTLLATTVPAESDDLTATTVPAEPTALGAGAAMGPPTGIKATTVPAESDDLTATTVPAQPRDFKASTPVRKPADLGAEARPGAPKNFKATTALREPDNLGAEARPGAPKTFKATTLPGAPDNLGAEARPGAPKTFKATTVPAAPTGLYALLEPRDLAATTVPAEPDDLTAATLPAAPEDLAAAQDLHEWLYDTYSPDETLLYSETGHGGGGFSWAQDEWLASVPTGTSYTFRTNPNDTYSTLNTNRRYEADAVYPFGGKAVYWKTWFSKDQYILCPYLKYYGLRDLEAMKQSPFSTVIYNWDNTYNSQHHAWYFDYVHRNSWTSKRFRYWILSNTAGTYRHVFVVQVLQATPSDPNNLDGWAQKGTPASHITHDYSAFPGAHDLSGKSTLYQGGGPVPMGTQGSLWKDVDAAIPGSVATAFAGTDPHGTRKALFSNT